MKKALAFILFLISLILFVSCSKLVPTKTETTEKTTTSTDTVRTIVQRDTTFVIERETVSEVIPESEIEKLLEEIRSSKRGQTIIQKSDGRAEVKLMLDSLGNLVASADCREQELLAQIQDQRTVINNQSETIRETVTTLEEQKTLIGKIGSKVTGFFTTLVWIIVIAVVLLIVINKIPVVALVKKLF